MPSPSSHFSSSIRKLEDLPSDGGKAVDTLAGANLRIFIRLNELEAALARVGRRVAVLEGTAGPEAIVAASPEPEEEPVERPAAPPADSVVVYTLGGASKACGRAKKTLAQAIAAGRLQAAKTADGSYAIDPDELRRVYPS